MPTRLAGIETASAARGVDVRRGPVGAPHQRGQSCHESVCWSAERRPNTAPALVVSLSAPPSPAASILSLRRAVGNAAVAGLLQRQPAGQLGPPGTAPATPRKKWSSVPDTERMAYVMGLFVRPTATPRTVRPDSWATSTRRPG